MPARRAIVCSKCGVLLTDDTKSGGKGGVCGACNYARQALYRAARKESGEASVKGVVPVSGYGDLTPIKSGGFIAWAVITTERRVAGGEHSPHAAFYIYHDKRGEE